MFRSVNSFILNRFCGNLPKAVRYASDTPAPAVAAPAVKKISAAKLKSIAGSIVKRQHLTVETDAYKLTKYVCGANIYIDGKDPLIKPDSEYPDWLWTLKTDWTPTPVEELDKDSFGYWRVIRKKAMLRTAQQRKIKRKMFKFDRW